MDSRDALKHTETLRFNNGIQFTILHELARGGSSIVYHAFYTDSLGEKKTVRIKECYPFQCRLKRGEHGELVVPAAEKTLFEETKQKMLRAYQLGNAFFHTDGLTNLTANTYNIFEKNNTLYIVSAYSQGQELSYQRYATVKDSIAAVKSAADAIRKIHSKGFLYLDIKPSNILTLEGTTELIQLFDFDTVVPLSDVTEAGRKISCTKGFAAPEQQMGDYQRLGTHTDVYGIGALLFYMLFDRVPDAFDCEPDAEYDYSKSKLSGADYQDTLTFRLTDFFRHTLANYYLDRYSSMETVVEKLSELQALADLSVRYVVNSRIGSSGLFLGRSGETRWISEKLTGNAGGCFFIVGMGGIGKSTLVRNSLKHNEGILDSVLYLNYMGSIEKTILDDYSVHIHSVRKDKAETDETYFIRKLGVLRELGRGKTCALIIDNYTGDETDALPKLLQLGWTVIFITRDKALSAGYPTLEVGPIEDGSDLLSLFSRNIGRELTEEERRSAASIIESVGGHTLVTELIAKQIGSPVCSLSVEKAADIAATRGFSSMADWKIDYQKDSILYHSTIKQILAGLFEADALSVSQRTILKTLSLFGRTEVSIVSLCEMLADDRKEDIRVLYHQGWLHIEDTVMTMHPVIEEVVCNWELSESAKDAAAKVLLYLVIKLRVEAKREEYPKNYLSRLQNIRTVFGNASGSWLDRWDRHVQDTNELDWTIDVFRSRLESSTDNTVTDHDKVQTYLRLSTAVLEGGKKDPDIYSLALYKELLYYTIHNTSYETEAYLKEKSEEFIALFDHDNERMLLSVYQRLLEVLYEHGEFDEAKRRIAQARKTILGNHSPYIWGQFYYMAAAYYDAVLDGAYDARTDEETLSVRHLLSSLDKAIQYMSLSGAGDSGICLGEYCRFKALVLIRSGIGTAKQVRSILKRIQKLIDRFAQPNSRLVRDYYMTLAWYHTYLDADIGKTRACLSKAHEITRIISISDLDRIEEQLSPAANILLEWQRFDDAAGYLLLSIVICEKHMEIAVYAKKQVKLLGYLLQVFFCAKEYKKCQTVIDLLDEKIGKDETLDIEDYVPAKIRQAVTACLTDEGEGPDR